jgi:hypothetical protein
MIPDNYNKDLYSRRKDEVIERAVNYAKKRTHNLYYKTFYETNNSAISEQRKDEVIKQAVDYAKKRTHNLVLTRFDTDKKPIDKVA